MLLIKFITKVLGSPDIFIIKFMDLNSIILIFQIIEIFNIKRRNNTNGKQRCGWAQNDIMHY